MSDTKTKEVGRTPRRLNIKRATFKQIICKFQKKIKEKILNKVGVVLKEQQRRELYMIFLETTQARRK